MTRNDIRAELTALAEPAYRDFARRLIPEETNLLGVRLPALRKLARRLIREDNGAALLADPPETATFEETLLWGMVLGAAALPLDTRLQKLAVFVPCITNWSLCDSFVASLRFSEAELPALRRFLVPYLTSRSAFEARFGAVMLLRFFVTEKALPDTVAALCRLPSDAYAARMGAAWALCECVLRFPDAAPALMERNPPAPAVRRMTLNKLLESRRLPERLRPVLRARRAEL